MSLLKRQITHADLVGWGVLDRIRAGTREGSDEALLMKWMGNRDAVSLEDALAVETHPSHIFWVVMREQVLPGRVLHQVALDWARAFLDRATQRGVRLDPRTVGAVEAKQAWIDEKISGAELRIHHLRAVDAFNEIKRHADPLALAAARVGYRVARDNASNVFPSVYYTILDVPDDDASSNDDVIGVVRQSIENYDRKMGVG